MFFVSGRKLAAQLRQHADRVTTGKLWAEKRRCPACRKLSALGKPDSAGRRVCRWCKHQTPAR